MTWLQENWIIAVVGLVIAVVLLWWLFGRSKDEPIDVPVAAPATRCRARCEARTTRHSPRADANACCARAHRANSGTFACSGT